MAIQFIKSLHLEQLFITSCFLGLGLLIQFGFAIDNFAIDGEFNLIDSKLKNEVEYISSDSIMIDSLNKISDSKMTSEILLDDSIVALDSASQRNSILTTDSTDAIYQHCESFNQIELAFENHNEKLIDWNQHQSCSEEELYRIYYLQGKVSYYLDNSSLAIPFLEKALKLTGSDDEEIFFLLSELYELENGVTPIDSFYKIMRNKYSSSLFLRDDINPIGLDHIAKPNSDRDKNWGIQYSLSTKLTNKYPYVDEQYFNIVNRLSLGLSQKIGELKIQENIGAYAVVLPESIASLEINNWSAFAGLSFQFKKTMLNIGYNFSYNSSFSDTSDIFTTWNYESFQIILMQMLSPTKYWDLDHDLVFFQIQPNWKFIEVTQSHTFYNKKFAFVCDFSFEDNFISWGDPTIDEGVYDGFITLSTQQEFKIKGKKNTFSISFVNDWERNSFKSLEAITLTDILGNVEILSYEEVNKNDWTHVFTGYLTYKQNLGRYFSIYGIAGGGIENIAGEELIKDNSLFFVGRAGLSIKI